MARPHAAIYGFFRPAGGGSPGWWASGAEGNNSGSSEVNGNGCRSQARKDIAMSILISVLITFLVVILVLYLINMLPVDGRIRQILQVVVILIGVLSLLRALAVGFGTI